MCCEGGIQYIAFVGDCQRTTGRSIQVLQLVLKHIYVTCYERAKTYICNVLRTIPHTNLSTIYLSYKMSSRLRNRLEVANLALTYTSLFGTQLHLTTKLILYDCIIHTKRRLYHQQCIICIKQSWLATLHFGASFHFN